MEEAVSVFRTEKKYQINKIKKSQLVRNLADFIKADNHSGFNGYQVRSLYFDSIFDDDYLDKIDGIEKRKKIRLRIYQPDQEWVKLELKQKQGAAQLKKSLTISKDLAKQLILEKYSGLMELEDPFASELYTIMETGLYRPKCVIEYHRLAFMEETNDIRITFDSDIEASSDYLSFFANNIMYSPVADDVLEVKYNRFLLGPIKQAIDIGNESEIAISKYAMAREIIG